MVGSTTPKTRSSVGNLELEIHVRASTAGSCACRARSSSCEPSRRRHTIIEHIMPRESCRALHTAACKGWCGTHCAPNCCASDAWLQQQASRHSNNARTLVNLRQHHNRSIRIMLWQGEKNHAAHPLTYMYWPVFGTLVAGLSSRGANVTIGAGFSQRYHQTLQSLRSGDTFLWVGVSGRLSQPWAKLRKEGIRTVYYNTEPALACEHMNRDSVDELWDFSLQNLLRCATWPERPNVLRYIPPGYLDERLVGLAKRATRPSLIFFGGLQAQFESRVRCFSQLKAALGPRLQQRYDIWNASAFSELMQTSDIFLNLHKQCRSRQPITFRVAVLLNQAKLVISERAYCLDEHDYRDLAQFVSVKNLASAFEKATADDSHALQDRAHALFAHRFSPHALFRRARVYSDWGLEDGGAREDGGASLPVDGVGALYYKQPPSELFSTASRVACATEYEQALRLDKRRRRGPVPPWQLADVAFLPKHRV